MRTHARKGVSLEPHDCLKRKPALALSTSFTLIEMLVVVVLISILAGSVVVSFKGRSERYAVDAAIKDLAAATTYAAEQAREQGYVYRIAFEPGSFRVERATGDAADVFTNVEGIAGQKRYLQSDLVVVERDNVVSEPRAVHESLLFTPAGGGFSGVLEVMSQRTGYRAQLEIMPDTRQVRVLKAELATR